MVIKDGGSTDGSLAYVEEVFGGAIRTEKDAQGKVKLINQSDRGIYDAMNQAVVQATGRYVYF